ncbi:MAG: sulfite exporter TauE/SafE family protein [Lentilitoribacter sp.]
MIDLSKGIQLELPLSFFILSAVAITITGISKSGFAGGLGVMNVPLMSLFISPQFALAILMPILIVMDIIIIWHYRKAWDRSIVMMLIPGAVLGVAIGGLTFHFMDANLIKFVVGLISLILVVQFFFITKPHMTSQKSGRVIPFVLGAVSGFSGFIAHAGGPPVKGFLIQQKPDKTEFVATNGAFVFFINTLKCVGYTILGNMTFESMKISLLLSPMIFIGIALGTYLHNLINPKVFSKFVYLLLSIAGVKLLWDSVPAIVKMI